MKDLTALPSRCSGHMTTTPCEARDPTICEYAFLLPPRPCENMTVGQRLFGVFGSSTGAFLTTGMYV